MDNAQPEAIFKGDWMLLNSTGRSRAISRASISFAEYINTQIHIRIDGATVVIYKADAKAWAEILRWLFNEKRKDRHVV